MNESVFHLSDEFLNGKSEDDFAGGVELAFMSTSTELAIATEYAKRGNLAECTIFTFTFDAASRAADVQWISQYPYEKELLYPPCTYITVESVSPQ